MRSVSSRRNGADNHCDINNLNRANQLINIFTNQSTQSSEQYEQHTSLKGPSSSEAETISVRCSKSFSPGVFVTTAIESGRMNARTLEEALLVFGESERESKTRRASWTPDVRSLLSGIESSNSRPACVLSAPTETLCPSGPEEWFASRSTLRSSNRQALAGSSSQTVPSREWVAAASSLKSLASTARAHSVTALKSSCADCSLRKCSSETDLSANASSECAPTCSSSASASRKSRTKRSARTGERNGPAGTALRFAARYGDRSLWNSCWHMNVSWCCTCDASIENWRVTSRSKTSFSLGDNLVPSNLSRSCGAERMSTSCSTLCPPPARSFTNTANDSSVYWHNASPKSHCNGRAPKDCKKFHTNVCERDALCPS